MSYYTCGPSFDSGCMYVEMVNKIMLQASPARGSLDVILCIPSRSFFDLSHPPGPIFTAYLMGPKA